MNRRKVVGVIVALCLAVAGTGLLVAYVNGAEDRALEGEELVDVVTADGTIDAGTPAEDLRSRVSVEQVPAKVRAEGAVGSVDELAGLVASIQLRDGEQLLRVRFVDPVTFERDAGRIADIPDGMQEITLSLEPERAGGGALLPGDRVGVFASFEPFNVSSEVPLELDDGVIIPPNGSTPNSTRVLLHKVLVTNVQLEELPEVADQKGLGDELDREVRLAPTGNVLVSVAVDTFDAERLVFTAEFGTIWLSLEPEHAIEAPSLVQNRGSVYVDLVDTGSPELRGLGSPRPAEGGSGG